MSFTRRPVSLSIAVFECFRQTDRKMGRNSGLYTLWPWKNENHTSLSNDQAQLLFYLCKCHWQGISQTLLEKYISIFPSRICITLKKTVSFIPKYRSVITVSTPCTCVCLCIWPARLIALCSPLPMWRFSVPGRGRIGCVDLDSS